jgi:tRNA pseudouridine55 synthase
MMDPYSDNPPDLAQWSVPQEQKHDGFAFVHKPVGMTSYDVLRRIKVQRIKQGLAPVKLGHSGTLDPFAEGLLIVLFGKATAFGEIFLHLNKTYEGHLIFGQKTATGDPTSPVIQTAALPAAIQNLPKIAHRFLGNYDQVPPMFSATKIQGKRLYELARKGIVTPRPAKKRTIYQLHIDATQYCTDPIHNVSVIAEAQFSATVSSGTYIRTLAEDLAQAAQSVGTLKSLKRTHIGPFSLELASTDWQSIKLVGFPEMLSQIPHLQHLTVSKRQAWQIRAGQKDTLSDVLRQQKPPLFEHIVLWEEGNLVALLKMKPHENSALENDVLKFLEKFKTFSDSQASAIE